MSVDVVRRRLARIRCLSECIRCFSANDPLPEHICYVPKEIEYKVTVNGVRVAVYSEAHQKSRKLAELLCSNETLFYASGEELSTSEGQWVRINKYINISKTYRHIDGWLLVWDSRKTTDDPPHIVAVNELNEPTPNTSSNLLSMMIRQRNLSTSWQENVNLHYSLHGELCQGIHPVDQDAVDRLRHIPYNWSQQHDEDLVNFLNDKHETNSEQLGSVKNYVESVDVSSACDDDEGPSSLTDGDPDTYWESDGNQGAHWIRLKMKKATVIKKLLLTVDGSDDNYMPYHIVVMGGQSDNLKKLNDLHLDLSVLGIHDVCVLDDMNEHYPVVEIRIKDCKDDGIDTRIHGIKIKSTKERDIGMSRDLFKREKCVRYPKLEGYEAEILYRRALLLQRFAVLLDSVIQYLLPEWEFSLSTLSILKPIKHILPLSKRRLSLIDTFLRESETNSPPGLPKLYINRQIAADHRGQPSLDPECKNAIFNQIYEGLKPKNRLEKPMDYRWSSRYDQWWECKFIAEGIIDQGGGFRDSLADIAEELCPTMADCPMPLPYFVRSPNQTQDESNINRDVYIPSPSCQHFIKYHWIGQVMGACLRGKESLVSIATGEFRNYEVLSLPPFIWKKLVGDKVTWRRDFITVDRSEVKVMETMELLDELTFNALFGEDRTWTATLSDGRQVPLKANGADTLVTYTERLDYINKLKEARMSESDKQIAAIRGGLVSVVPLPVLEILTWKEVEKRICGDPEITVEALKKTTHYEDLEQSDTRIKHMWDAITNFSNEDRSRFLRFVTGRRRLPAPLYICPDKGESTDALPESSTCSNTLYLPNYSSAKLAEDKLRYAAYNCIAIDTDMNTWDE